MSNHEGQVVFVKAADFYWIGRCKQYVHGVSITLEDVSQIFETGPYSTFIETGHPKRSAYLGALGACDIYQLGGVWAWPHDPPPAKSYGGE